MSKEDLFELLRAFVPIIGVLVAVVGVVYAIRSYGLNKFKKMAAGLGAGAYALFPFDLLPDLLVPLGLIDDACIISGAIGYILRRPSASRAHRAVWSTEEDAGNSRLTLVIG